MIFNPVFLLRQVRQFVIMGRKQSFNTGFMQIMQILHHRPGNAQSVIGAGSAADFIHDNQTVFAGVVKDIGRFLHFDHKSALSL